jgi:anti-sigma factor RsiW
MACGRVRELLGAYLDGEAAPGVRAEIDEHLSGCRACSDELGELQRLASALAQPEPASLPPGLWSEIERRLGEPSVVTRRFRGAHRFRPYFALAASIVIVVGLGLFGFPWGRESAVVHADTVDFATLLDALQGDAVTAFDRFLTQYNARETTVADTKRYAPELNFDLPSTLPNGFQLRAVYTLRFGDAPGVAARYELDGEFLGAVFHPPVLREHYGTHKDRSCVVGKHRGHKVPVGEWSLVHLTDPTTCHCVLSRLDADKELPAVMAALAPSSPTMIEHDHDDSGP